MANKTLYRSKKNRLIAGVAGGLAEYFDIDPTIVRVGFIILALINGVGIILYIIMWLVVSENPDHPRVKKEAPEEMKEKAEEFAQKVKQTVGRWNLDRPKEQVIAGLVLVVVGGLFLVQNFFQINVWGNFWPLILIAVGLGIIIKSSSR